jgi:hypothetical protein
LPDAWGRTDRVNQFLVAHPEHRLISPYETVV